MLDGDSALSIGKASDAHHNVFSTIVVPALFLSGFLRHNDSSGVMRTSVASARAVRLHCLPRAWAIMINRRQGSFHDSLPLDLCTLVGIKGLRRLAVASHLLGHAVRQLTLCPLCQSRRRNWRLPCGHKVCRDCISEAGGETACPRCGCDFSDRIDDIRTLTSSSDPRTSIITPHDPQEILQNATPGSHCVPGSILDSSADPRTDFPEAPSDEVIDEPPASQIRDLDAHMEKLKEFQQKGDLFLALECFSAMKRDGWRPDVKVYNILIDICAKQNNFMRAENFLEQMVNDGLQPNLISFNCLIKASINQQEMAMAEHWFAESCKHGCEADAKTYTLMVDGYLKQDQQSKAEEWLSHGLSIGCANIVTLRVVADYFSNRGLYAKTEQWLDRIRNIKADFVWTRREYGLMLNAHASAADVRGSQQWLRMMERSGYAATTLEYTNLLKACLKARDRPAALAIFTEQAQRNLRPDYLNLSTLTGILGKVGAQRLCHELGVPNLEEAKHEFEAVAPELGLNPKTKHWGWRRNAEGIKERNDMTLDADVVTSGSVPPLQSAGAQQGIRCRQFQSHRQSQAASSQWWAGSRWAGNWSSAASRPPRESWQDGWSWWAGHWQENWTWR